MATVLTCIVERPADAQSLINELTSSCMCDRADISVLARDQSWTHQAAKTLHTGVDTASSAFNALFDGVRAVSEAMPGGGMLRAAGDFAVQLARRGVSTGSDMAKGLIDAGVPEGDARRYGEAFASGGILVTVQAKTDKAAQCARKVMASRGAKVTA